MRHRIFLPLLAGPSVSSSTGCAATHREWEVWRAHPTHYATTNHMAFSMGNMVGGAPRVTPEMMDQARGEGWWGRNTPFVGPRAECRRAVGRHLERLRHAPARCGAAWRRRSSSSTGATGQGRLVLEDSQVAEGVPLAIREKSSFGSPIELSGQRDATCG